MWLLTLAVVTLLMGSALAFALLVRQQWTIPRFLGALVLPVASAILVGHAALLRSPELHNYRLILVFEAFFSAPLLFVSCLFMSGRGLLGVKFKAVLAAIALLLPVGAVLGDPATFYLVPVLMQERVLFIRDAGFAFYVGLVVLEAYALFSLEKCLSVVLSGRLWRIKYQVLGLSVVVFCFFLFHLQAFIHRTLDLGLLPFLVMGVFLGSLMAAYGFFRWGIIAPFAVSQRVTYRSVVMVLIGLYLAVVGLAGEGFKYLPVSGERWIVLLVAVVLGLGLLLLLMSDDFRRRLKVALHKNLLQSKYEYRDQWIAFTAALGRATSENELHHNILDAFCRVFQAEVAGLFLRREGSLTCDCMAQRNMELMVAPWTVEPRFFSTADNAPWVLDLQALSCEDPVLNCWQGCGVRFLIPVSYGGEIEGVVALGGLLQDDEFTYEDYDLMKVLAQQAGANLLALRLTGELSTQREMAAIAQVTTFVLHDIKNHVSGLSLLLDNAREHIANPDFQQDLLRTLGASIQKMNHLMGKLRNLRGQAPLKLVPCDLADIARGAIDDSRIAGIIHEFAPAPIDADSAEIHKVVLNLLLNARDAIETQGAITVCTGRGGNKAFLRVDDTGCGMTEEFLRQRLFRPLETTKDQGLGIGMFQCRNIVQAHGGSLEVDSQLGKGTRITVWLPLSRKIDPLEEGAHG